MNARFAQSPRVVNWNGTWYVYVQGAVVPEQNAKVFVATGPSLNSLSWVTDSNGQAHAIVQSVSSSGVGIGEFHQWFNSGSYRAVSGAGNTIMGVYNDWNLSGVSSFYELTALSPDGISANSWYGPTSPVLGSNMGELYPDVILAGSLDAPTYGDISFTLGNGFFSGQAAYRPVVGLGFYNAPYSPSYNGQWIASQPIATFNSNPGYYNTVIATTGVNNSGFRPRFARNPNGYLDPAPGNHWITYVYYTSNQVGLDSDTADNYTQYQNVDGMIGVSKITIIEQ